METVTNNELLVIIDQSGVEQQTGATLKEKFLPFFEQAEDWKMKAEAIVVTDETQKHEMQIARQARLALREIRIAADKTRKELKEDSLRYGKAVQGVYNVIEYLIKPIEDHLEKQEKFIEIQAAEKKAQISAHRRMGAQPFMEYIPANIDLADLSDNDFQNLLNGAKFQLQQKIDAEQKAESERIEREQKDSEERERIRAENEKLKIEAEAHEKQILVEREKAEAAQKEAEAKIKAEREAREKVEAEAKANAEAAQKEAEAKKAKLDAEEKARKSAPDKAKLNTLADSVAQMEMPSVSGENARQVIVEAKAMLERVEVFIRNSAAKI